MSEHACAARGFGSFVGVERPADDDASAMLAKLQQLAERRCESNGQALDERQQAEDARRLLIVKREPALALRVELLLVQGQVVAMQGRILGLDPVQLQPLLVGKVFRTPPSHSSSLSRKRERIRRCVPFHTWTPSRKVRKKASKREHLTGAHEGSRFVVVPRMHVRRRHEG